jgi:hypothetical protein
MANLKPDVGQNTHVNVLHVNDSLHEPYRPQTSITVYPKHVFSPLPLD